MKRAIPSRLVALFGLLMLTGALTAAAASAASPGLDTHYGTGGVAMLTLPSAPAKYLSVLGIAPARDGSAYVLATQADRDCGVASCARQGLLYRVDSNGSLDPGFGGAGSVVLQSAPEGYLLTVDSRNRALVGAIGSASVAVTRFARGGYPDAGFGAGGTVSLPCACDRELLELVPAGQRRTLLVRQTTLSPQNASPSRRATLTRLLPDGGLDKAFGAAGTVGFGLGVRAPASSIAVTGKGAILMANVGCCSGSRSWLFRVSQAGRLDTHFNRVAGSSLHRLRRLDEGAGVSSVLPRSGGGIDLFGAADEAGFELRLRGDGRLARFGKEGLLRLPFSVRSAVPGVNGATFILGDPERRGRSAFRLLGDGRFDPRFGGSAGIAVPLANEGQFATALGGGRVAVVDYGETGCREYCPPHPQIARFIEVVRRH